MIKPLTELAKELGIRPDPNLTAKGWTAIKEKIGQRLLTEKTGLPATDRHEVRRHRYPANLNDHVYTLHKYLNRHWSEHTIDTAEKILLKDKDTRHDVMIHVSQIGFQTFKDTPYIWHTASGTAAHERFTVDLDLSSPHLEQAIDAMDAFITKYHGEFKVSNHNSCNRCDTMNVYLPTNITPDMAAALYQAVKPALDTRHHERLNGFDILMDGRPVRGIKIGPESRTADTEEEQAEIEETQRDAVYNILLRDLPHSNLTGAASDDLSALAQYSSLSKKCIALEMADLLYYAIGKEGKSPFTLSDYDGKPYHKHIDFKAPPRVQRIAGKTQPIHFWERLFPTPHKESPAQDWKNPEQWRSVMVYRDSTRDYVYGHRINITDLPTYKRNEIKQELTVQGIQFTERRATRADTNIRVGDETLRITHPDSIRRLRRHIFGWKNPDIKPITITEAELAVHHRSHNNGR